MIQPYFQFRDQLNYVCPMTDVVFEYNKYTTQENVLLFICTLKKCFMAVLSGQIYIWSLSMCKCEMMSHWRLVYNPLHNGLILHCYVTLEKRFHLWDSTGGSHNPNRLSVWKGCLGEWPNNSVMPCWVWSTPLKMSTNHRDNVSFRRSQAEDEIIIHLLEIVNRSCPVIPSVTNKLLEHIKHHTLPWLCF